MKRFTGQASVALAAFLLCMAFPIHGRASTAYVHVLRGRVQYQAGGGKTWGPLPATLMVNAGDRIKLKAGSRARVVYLKGGGKVIVRGPRVYAIRKGSRVRPSGRTSGVGFFKLLRMLVARNASYHKAGVASLSETGKVAGFINLLSPRYGAVRSGKVTLRWANVKGGVVNYQVAVWRYLPGGREQKVTRKVACRRRLCAFAVPSTFVFKSGVRHYWNVKVAGTAEEPYPSVGIWFTVAGPQLLAKLTRDLAAAAGGPAAGRSFRKALALAVYGFHQQALDEAALKNPRTPNARKLRARLLCVTCRAAQANKAAGKTFCKCREDPDR